MSSKLFAKIKIRRGLKADLPDLDKAEFGFTTDTGEVFIGAPELPSLQNKGRSEPNEQFPYKNVQLITAQQVLADIQPYVYKSNSDTVAQTGPSPSQPVQRSYQQKFDDYINIVDFIDDESNIAPAITRALQQNHNVKKTLHIPAGNHIINTPFQITPSAHIKGEGIDRTFLTHTNVDSLGPTYLAETSDNKFQTGLQISFNQGGLPNNILIEDMTITIPRLMDFFRINRAQNVKFKNVKFKGAGATTSTTHVFTFDRLGIVVDMNDFIIEDCIFEDVSNVFNDAILQTNVIRNVRIRNNKFRNVFKLLTLDNTNSTEYEFSGNRVSRHFSNFITLIKGNNFKSYNNHFVENQNNVPITISSTFQKFSSVNDTFNTTQTIVNNSKTSTIILSDNKTMIVNDLEKSSLRTFTLQANTTDIIPLFFDKDKYDFVTIEYKLVVNNEVKVGHIALTKNQGNVVLFDTGQTTGPTNLFFTGEEVTANGADNMAIRFTNQNITDGTLKLHYNAVIQ